MLDHLAVVSHGGVVLFSWTSKQLRRDPINQLIRSVLIEDRAGDSEYTQDEYKLRWCLANEAQFMVIAVYQSFLQLLCLDGFLKDIKHHFQEKFGVSTLSQGATVDIGKGLDFEIEFQALFEEWKEKEQAAGGEASVGEPSSGIGNGPIDSSSSNLGGADPAGNPTTKAGSPTTLAKTNSFTSSGGKTIMKRGAKGVAAPAKAPAGSPTSATATPTTKRVKKPTLKNPEHSGSGFVDPDEEKANHVNPTEEEKQQQVANFRNQLVAKDTSGDVIKMDDKDWDKKVERGRVQTWFRSRFGTRELDAQDFKIIIPQLRDKLISKNVAVEIAEKVCESVETALSGKKIGSFESLPSAIEKAMVASLHRILEPRREINILREIAVARERRKPYSIVFCGVNGVGKSTSVAKVTYWLQQHDQSILLAACDTFRTGAVEQLMVHGDCLDTPVFSMGQSGANTDAAAVAGAALKQATKEGTNVVLIDTAGRMQDHESRMRALAKLIHDNLPDLVLFVGEAVVGNNGIDQLRKFNQCLVDFTPLGRQPRGIDGILLTKFDTVDDKVGASVSMVYELGQPIVFVGVGQQYQDLKTISADVVVDMLMQ